MKTVAELAKEKSVSVQTIYRVLNRVKQETGECLTEKKSGIAHINSKGVEILNERLTGVKQENKKMFNSVKQAESEEITFLREQNRILQEELNKEREHSRTQLDKITDLAGQMAELTRNNQILLKQEQDRNKNPMLISDKLAEPEKDKPKKKGFFSFWKR